MTAPDPPGAEFEAEAPPPDSSPSSDPGNHANAPNSAYRAWPGSPMLPYHMMPAYPPPPAYPMHWGPPPPLPPLPQSSIDNGGDSSNVDNEQQQHHPPPPPPHPYYPPGYAAYPPHPYMMMHPTHAPHHPHMMPHPAYMHQYQYPPPLPPHMMQPPPPQQHSSEMTPHHQPYYHHQQHPKHHLDHNILQQHIFEDGLPNNPNSPIKRQQNGNQYKTGRWSFDEKLLFLFGLARFGKGKWKKISAYLPQRSLIQIKSHAQKVLKREAAGENVMRRLDENKPRVELLVGRAHARLGGPPPVRSPPKRKRNSLPDDDQGEDGENDDDDDENDNKEKEQENENKKNGGDAPTSRKKDEVDSKIPRKETIGRENEKLVVARDHDEGTKDEIHHDEADEESPPKRRKTRATYMDAASVLCQMVGKEGHHETDRIDTRATIGLAPTPMKSMAESERLGAE
ncbi:hypothetical protein MPSEU_000363300 [Mayamaea pseudoterrestris]|nr:hypothetical protein MPSEU_000363300 [Mayamaea pseudoterrestris]